jgi:hypothetical protein
MNKSTITIDVQTDENRIRKILCGVRMIPQWKIVKKPKR